MARGKDRLTLTVPEAAKLLRLGRNQAYAAVKSGEIPSISFGKSIRVPIAALERMLNVPQAK